MIYRRLSCASVGVGVASFAARASHSPLKLAGLCPCGRTSRRRRVKLHYLLVFYLETDSELELEAVLTEIVWVVDFQAHY